jgi:hypothetical protein
MFRSICNSSISLLFIIFIYIIQSSAKSLIGESIFLQISFMYARNSSGPSTLLQQLQKEISKVIQKVSELPPSPQLNIIWKVTGVSLFRTVSLHLSALCLVVHKLSDDIRKQEVLERTNHLIPLIWHEPQRKRSKNSSILACVIVAVGMCLPSRWLATTKGIHIQTHSESMLTTEELLKAVFSLLYNPQLYIDENSLISSSAQNPESWKT